MGCKWVLFRAEWMTRVYRLSSQGLMCGWAYTVASIARDDGGLRGYGDAKPMDGWSLWMLERLRGKALPVNIHTYVHRFIYNIHTVCEEKNRIICLNCYCTIKYNKSCFLLLRKKLFWNVMKIYIFSFYNHFSSPSYPSLQMNSLCCRRFSPLVVSFDNLSCINISN